MQRISAFVDGPGRLLVLAAIIMAFTKVFLG